MIQSEEEFIDKRKQLEELRRQKEALNRQINPLERDVREWIDIRNTVNARAQYTGKCFKCFNEAQVKAHDLPLALKVLHIENNHGRPAFYCCGLRQNSISTEECIYLMESLKLTLMGGTKPTKIDCYKEIFEEEFNVLKQEIKERL